MEKWLIGAVVVVLVAVMIFSMGNLEGGDSNEINQVCFENNKSINGIDGGHNCFDVEIADSDYERSTGLMYRESLCEDCGMLFVYNEDRIYRFWMKNTLIPLDIIWLDSNWSVVHIANAVPCLDGECELYNPGKESRYVLEVNSGKAEEMGAGVGSTLKPN